MMQTNNTNTVIYTCPYIPAEWIAAHGMAPRRIIPSSRKGAGGIGSREGICPFAAAFATEIIKGDDFCGYIVTTLCDQMRRMFEAVSEKAAVPGFLMNVPNTWQNTTARNIYANELKRLGIFLTKLGGNIPDDKKLSETMTEYDTARNSLYSGQETVLKGKAVETISVAIIGGPMTREDSKLLELLEEMGASVVLNGTETGSRTIPRSFKPDKMLDNPLEELIDAYFGCIPDASRRPDSQLYNWLDSQLKLTKPRGIILWRYVWCDMWHAQSQRLRTWCNVPVIEIDSSGNNNVITSGTRRRIAAFLEMLR